MITPIIMESDLGEVERKLGILREKKADRVHIDIGDGLFSDLLTIAPADLQQFDLLAQQQMCQKGQVKAYHSDLTFIVREYLENRYGI